MPSIRAEMSADLANAIALYGETFEWQGRTIPCVRRDEPTPQELQDAGGFIEHVKYWLVVSKLTRDAQGTIIATFPNVLPQNGDLINNRTHQIKDVRGDKNPAAPQLVLAIGSVDD